MNTLPKEIHFQIFSLLPCLDAQHVISSLYHEMECEAFWRSYLVIWFHIDAQAMEKPLPFGLTSRLLCFEFSRQLKLMFSRQVYPKINYFQVMLEKIHEHGIMPDVEIGLKKKQKELLSAHDGEIIMMRDNFGSNNILNRFKEFVDMFDARKSGAKLDKELAKDRERKFLDVMGNADWDRVVQNGLLVPAGLQNMNNEQGLVGYQGLVQPAGYLTGNIDEMGPRGLAGIPGPMGIQGPIGCVGATGCTGPTGPTVGELDNEELKIPVIIKFLKKLKKKTAYFTPHGIVWIQGDIDMIHFQFKEFIDQIFSWLTQERVKAHARKHLKGVYEDLSMIMEVD